MSKRYKAKRRFRYYVHRQRCQARRCTGRGVECRLNSWDGRPNAVLCGEHALLAGYCPGCGLFWAGVESFDFSRYGLCEHCAAEAASDSFEGDEDYGDGVDRGWCDTCQNSGMVNCYCGGDLCVCRNNGEMPCPDCDRGF